MLKKITSRLRNREGFTLIELLLIFAVLAVIAAIAIPQFLGVTDYTREKADKSAAEMAIRNVYVRVLIEEILLPDDSGDVVTVTDDTYGEALPIAQSNGGQEMDIFIVKTEQGIIKCVVTDGNDVDKEDLDDALAGENSILAVGIIDELPK